MSITKTLSPLLLTAALSTSALADVQIEYGSDVYYTGQAAELLIHADAGSVVFLLVDHEAGPTEYPGVGTLDVGPNADIINLGVSSGDPILLICGFQCGSPVANQPIYTQVVTYNAGDFCISNQATLNVVDDGECEATGCTPGYWKNHESEWAGGYMPGDDFGAIFGVDPIDGATTLADALTPDDNEIQPQTLPAHAVAALLNSVHPESNYPLSTMQIIEMVSQAILFGDLAEREAVKDQLDDFNNIGCPL